MPLLRDPNRSNEALFELRRTRAGDRHRELKQPLPDLAPADLLYLGTLVSSWVVGYGHRSDAILRIDDVPARDLLIARHRARNARYTKLPKMPAIHRSYATSIVADRPHLDVSNLVDIPGCGRSFLALWTEAQDEGLLPKQTMARFRQWELARPAAWNRRDAIDPRVARLLKNRLTWRSTGDDAFPWDISEPRSRLQIRLNDYPDEWMYTLFRNAKPLGDFHDWPSTWERSESPTQAEIVAAIEPSTLLPRYLAGEHSEVWRDLNALGEAILRPQFRSPARAVAHETMRRVRSNLVTIITRLSAMHYRFRTEPLRRCTPAEKKQLSKMNLPLSLRAWYQEVGIVDLTGYHRHLCPPEVKAGGIAASLEVKWPPKRRGLCSEADFRVEDQHRTYFVESIRVALRWGGFPGWALYESAPEKQIAALRRDLLPL
jgi:hypothetical protein